MIHAAKIDWVEAKYGAGDDQLVFQDERGNPVVTFDIPAGLLRDFITANALSSVYARLDGTVCSIIEEPDFVEVESKIAIDSLVERDVAPDMLEDEPDAKSALLLFEQRLKRSLDLVASALKGLEAQDR